MISDSVVYDSCISVQNKLKYDGLTIENQCVMWPRLWGKRCNHYFWHKRDIIHYHVSFFFSKLLFYTYGIQMNKIFLLRAYNFFYLWCAKYIFWVDPLLLKFFNEEGLVKADSDENFAAHSKFTIT